MDNTWSEEHHYDQGFLLLPRFFLYSKKPFLSCQLILKRGKPSCVILSQLPAHYKKEGVKMGRGKNHSSTKKVSTPNATTLALKSMGLEVQR